jgi:hypothetical protein
MVQIRYNTICDDNHKFYRVIINNIEHLASNIIINCNCYTTRDNVFDSIRNENVNKHHITCFANEIIWKGDVLILN